MVQGIAKEYIFDTDEMKNTYLFNLNHYKEDDGIKILAYCIMGNHCHLLLYAPNPDKLGRYMRRVNTRYAQYYNFKTERVGYVFRDRYKSQAIYDTKYVGNCLCYIHNNPINAGIAQKPTDYDYSSYNCYMQRMGIVDFDFAGEFFNTEPSNIIAIARECGTDADCPEWIEIKDNAKTVDDKAYEILAKYGMPPKFLKLDRPKMVECMRKLQEIGMTQKEIAKIFEFSDARSVRYVLK